MIEGIMSDPKGEDCSDCEGIYGVFELDLIEKNIARNNNIIKSKFNKSGKYIIILI